MEEHEDKKQQNETHHLKKRAFGKSFYKKVYIVLGVALILFALYNLTIASSFSTVLDGKIEEAKEDARPAQIQLTVISAACDDCYDINKVLEVIESTGANITSRREMDFSSPEAASLIEEYKIEKIPTVIVTGELEKSKSLSFKLKQIGEEREKAYIFTKQEPPFVDSASGEIRGKITLTILKKEDCRECFDITPIVEQLIDSGIKLEKQNVVGIDSEEGKALLKNYEIKKVPVLILDKEAEVYPSIKEGWNQIGSIENDGYFVMREINPPYYNVEEGKVAGLVSIAIIRDEGCANCYDPDRFHKPILKRMGVVFSQERNMSVSSAEGKSLIQKYNIEKVPTIILRGDVEEYPALVNAWKDVGTKEADGAYVFRSVEIAKQTYIDLTKNETVTPK